MAKTAGFEVQRSLWEPFALTLVCRAGQPAFGHRLPGEGEARCIGADVSAAGEARPQ
jgi:hypothetical protein